MAKLCVYCGAEMQPDFKICQRCGKLAPGVNEVTEGRPIQPIKAYSGSHYYREDDFISDDLVTEVVSQAYVRRPEYDNDFTEVLSHGPSEFVHNQYEQQSAHAEVSPDQVVWYEVPLPLPWGSAPEVKLMPNTQPPAFDPANNMMPAVYGPPNNMSVLSPEQPPQHHVSMELEKDSDEFLPDAPTIVELPKDDIDLYDYPTEVEQITVCCALVSKENGKRFEITLPSVIGRGTASDVRVSTDGHVGRAHAKIFEMDGAVYLTDLDSKNGTTVNGEKLENGATVELKNEMAVALGKDEFIFYKE